MDRFNKKILKAILISLIAIISYPLKAQTTLSDSIQMSVDFLETDIKKAESLLNVDERRLAAEPDSIQYMYHYFKAVVEEINGHSSKGQLQHLLTAKRIMENKLGINHSVYFEIINAIGEKYEDFGMPDSAMVYWEEGIIKGLSYIGTKDEDDNIKSIRDNLADYYKKQGHKEIARYIETFKPIDSFDYACEILHESFELETNGLYKEALDKVNEAVEIFLKNGQDGQIMLEPAYRRYLHLYSALNRFEDFNDCYIKHREEIINTAGVDGLCGDLQSAIYYYLFLNHSIEGASKTFGYLEIESLNASDTIKQENEKYATHIDNVKAVLVEINQLEESLEKQKKYSLQWIEQGNQLAWDYYRLNMYDKSKSLFSEIEECTTFDDSLNVQYKLLALNSLYDISIKDSDYKPALNAIPIRLKCAKILFGENGENVGWVYNQQCLLLMNLGRYDEAIRSLNDAEKILVPIYGKSSYEYATLLHNRGHIFQLKKEYKQAHILLIQARDLQIKTKGEAFPNTLKYLKEVEQSIKESL